MDKIALAAVWGFTGTRHGWTAPQRKKIEQLWRKWQPIELHHGDCRGSDYAMHNLALSDPNDPITVVVHPPVTATWRAWCRPIPGRVIVHETFPYLERDRHIVIACKYLLATPGEKEPKPHSGTWATIGIADRLARPTVIVFPDGKVKYQHFTELEVAA